MMKNNLFVIGIIFVFALGIVSAANVNFDLGTPGNGTSIGVNFTLINATASIPGCPIAKKIGIFITDSSSEMVYFLANWNNSGNPVYSNGAVSVANVNNFEYSFSSLLDAKYYFVSYAKNCSGSIIQASDIREITVDTLAPTTTDNAPTTNQTDKVTVTLNCTDAGSGCNVTNYCINTTGIGCVPDKEGNSVLLDSVGSFYISYFSSDKAGNVESVKNSTEIVIVSIPAPAIQAPSHSSGGGCYTRWTCTEFGTCVSGIQTRTCSYPANYCTPSDAKPSENQACTISIPTTQPIIIPTTQSQTEQTTTNPGRFSAMTGAVTGALGTPGSIILIIVIIAGVGIAYWLVRKKNIKGKGKGKSIVDKIKWKGKKD